MFIYIYTHILEINTQAFPRNGMLPNIQFGAMSRQGLENILSGRFRIFEPYQSSKNNIKQLKSNEKQ